MVIHTLFAIQRQLSPMACRDKYGHLLPLSKTQCLSIETIVASLCQPEASEPIDTYRQIRSSALLVKDSMSTDRDYFSFPFVNQRQASPLTHKDKYGHMLPLSKTQCLSTETVAVSPLPSREKRVRWHAETMMVIAPPFLSRDKRVRWHAETNYGHPHTFGIKRQASRWHAETIMVIRTLFVIQRRSSPMARRDNYGHLPLLHFEDDNIISHCMLSKGNNDLHLHFEDDNVFSHCMPSKATMTIICILKTTMSSVIACLQKATMPSCTLSKMTMSSSQKLQYLLTLYFIGLDILCFYAF